MRSRTVIQTCVQSGIAIGLLFGVIASALFVVAEWPSANFALVVQALAVEALAFLTPGGLADRADRMRTMLLLLPLLGGLAGLVFGLAESVPVQVFGGAPGHRARFRFHTTIWVALYLAGGALYAIGILDLPKRVFVPLAAGAAVLSLVAGFAAAWLLARLVPTRDPERARWVPVWAAGLCAVLFAALLLANGAGSRSAEADLRFDQRLIVFAADGLDRASIEPLLARDELPTIAGILERGASGPLRTHLPPIMSPVVWTSVATSRRPDEHGIRDFVAPRDPARPGAPRASPVHNGDRLKPAFWELLDSFGLSVALLSWYPSWPADSLAGGVVLTDRATYPNVEGRVRPARYEPLLDSLLLEGRNRLPELRRAFTDYDPAADTGDSRAAWLRRFNVNILDQSLLRDWVTVRFARAVLAEEQPHVLVVYFRGTDTAQHEFRKYHAARWNWWLTDRIFEIDPREADWFGDVVDSYFRFVDRSMAEILAHADPASNVMVIADHASGYSFDRATHFDHERMLTALGWSARADGGGLDRRSSRVLAYWDKAKSNRLGLFVNVRGRGPGGVVSKDALPGMLRDMQAELEAMRTTGGKRVFESVTIGPRAGERFADGDLFVKVNSFAVGGRFVVRGDTIAVREESAGFSRSGNHRLAGLFAFAGPDAADGARVRGATVYDVAPTICRLFGVPPARDWAGKVLSGAMSGSPEVGTVASYDPLFEPGGGQGGATEGANEKVMEELRALGYIQ